MHSLVVLLMVCQPLSHSFTAYAQPPAHLPTDPTVVHGNATFDTVGDHLTVFNSPSAILDWHSFSIGANQEVHFQQLNATSQVLNRVTGDDPSQILGNLSSNGGVWLINSHGVLFGQSARIDVAGLVTSTLDISNIDFLAGKYNFLASTAAAGQVTNQGDIRTSFGGRVWLLGDQVRNEGMIQTSGGNIVLAAGKSLELVDSGAPNIIVRVTAPENEVANLGSLVSTSGGTVDLHGSIVNQQGIVRADSLGVDGGGRISLMSSRALALREGSETRAEGGTVTMSAGTSTYLAGLVDVSRQQGTGGSIQLTTGSLEGMAGGTLRADGQQGGDIQVGGQGMVGFSSLLSAVGTVQGGTVGVTGDRVYLLNADVDASGGAHGGTVHIGGGWQGGGSLAHARQVLIGMGSNVSANGALGGNGGGGEVVVWSTQSSQHYGTLQALDGGRIELSSRGEIRQTGSIQAGSGGTVLFDPKNIIIADSPDNLTLAEKVVSANIPSGLGNNDFFGSAVALDGDRLAIGITPNETTSSGGHGAIHLFTGVGASSSGLTWIRAFSSESISGAPTPPPEGDFFGRSVSLDGDRLAVGAEREGADAVYLFNGLNSANFGGLTLRQTITSGTFNLPSIADDDRFGIGVAIQGDHLAVGASGTSNRGAVYLFSGMETSNFQGLSRQVTLDATLMPALQQANRFGDAVAIDGDRLAVGAGLDGTGAVHLFNGLNSANFSNLALQKRVASNFENTPDLGLGLSNRFGSSVALDGDALAVGAVSIDATSSVHLFSGLNSANFSNVTWKREVGPPNSDDTANFGYSVALDGDLLAVGGPTDHSNPNGAVYLYRGVSTLGSSPIGVPIGVDDATFANDPSATSFITPATLTALLNAGTSVILQANNDITVNSAVTVSPISVEGSGGPLSLHAGRNITFNANIITAGGFLDAIAGDNAANSAFREPGIPTISIANGVQLRAFAGASLAAVNGNFINNNGDSAISTSESRWVIYATNPATSTEGFSSYNKHYNQVYIPGSEPSYATDGNWFFYSFQPKLSVSFSPHQITYGDSVPTSLGTNFDGLVDGDTSPGLGSSAASSTIAGSLSSSGNPTAGFHDIVYTTGLSSSLGYQFENNPAIGNELEVLLKTVTASNITALNKIYDGTTTASLSNGALSGVVIGDLATLSGATGNFSDKNVGANKLVTATGLSLSGADAGNYAVSSTATTLADISTLGITGGITAAGKTYDATTAATITGRTLSGVLGDDNVNYVGGTANFSDKNAGVDKLVTATGLSLSGADAGNYTVNSSATTLADISALAALIGSVTVANKVYDATTVATITGRTLSGVRGDDNVTYVGGIANFNDKNAGNNKLVTATGLSLSGADAGNYAVNSTATTLADISTLGITGGITAADKTYDATTAATITGRTLSGVLGDDNVNYVGGTANFSDQSVGLNKLVTATGLGLSGADAGNYIVNPIATTTADIIPDAADKNPAFTQNTVQTSIQSINVAMLGAFPVLDWSTLGFVIDITSRAPNFGRLDLSRMSRTEMQQLIDMRREFKEKLFADAIYKLEQDPSLANVRSCPSLADINTGLCRITDAQRLQLASNERREESVKGPRRARVARLPQIERKFVILFGIDQYTDKTIPPLENAIFDAEVVGRLFAEKLGYEARVVKNATKADIVRTLNQLSTEMMPHDSVIVYYAGHGYRNDKTVGGYWIPSDASVSDASTWISNTDVSKMLAEIRAKQIVMIADSCYSGTFAEQKLGLSGAELKPDEVLAKRSVIVMSSGGDEPVADEGKGGHSIFAWDLMQALRNVDNWQPGTSIFEQVKRDVMKSFPQTPQYGIVKSAGHEKGGEYLFEFRQLE